MIYYCWLESPIGALLITSDSRSLTGLYLQGQKYLPQPTPSWQETDDLDLFRHTETQLAEYFTHQRQTFDLPIAPEGTPFQQEVWHLLRQIPFGTTQSYGTLATRLGKPTASRAVGAANGRNPISIIVPCHRVVATNGLLTGYAGGLDRKQWLLQHERGVIEGDRFQPIQQTLALFDES